MTHFFKINFGSHTRRVATSVDPDKHSYHSLAALIAEHLPGHEHDMLKAGQVKTIRYLGEDTVREHHHPDKH